MAYALTLRRTRLPITAEPNVIPFIDVLLVLLIIFMVTAPKPTTDLRVDMPPPVQGPRAAIEPAIVELRATPGGFAVFVGARETPLEGLGARALAHVLGANPTLTAAEAHAEARVFVRAEMDVAYAPVVAAVEQLQQARFRNVSIAAQNADEA